MEDTMQMFDDFMALLADETPETAAESNTEPEVDENDAVEVEENIENEEVTVDPDDTLTEGMESLAFLDMLHETCSKEEYATFLAENKTELELYGLVNPNAMAAESYEVTDAENEDIATEGRNIVRLNRDAQIAREEARIAIGLAKKSNDQLYKYYKKYSELKRKFRDKIYDKYLSRSTALARKAVMNSRNKAAAMNSRTGTTIINKIDSRLKQLDGNGRNKEAVRKPIR